MVNLSSKMIADYGYYQHILGQRVVENTQTPKAQKPPWKSIAVKPNLNAGK